MLTPVFCLWGLQFCIFLSGCYMCGLKVFCKLYFFFTLRVKTNSQLLLHVLLKNTWEIVSDTQTVLFNFVRFWVSIRDGAFIVQVARVFSRYSDRKTAINILYTRAAYLPTAGCLQSLQMFFWNVLVLHNLFAKQAFLSLWMFYFLWKVLYCDSG